MAKFYAVDADGDWLTRGALTKDIRNAEPFESESGALAYAQQTGYRAPIRVVRVVGVITLPSVVPQLVFEAK
jgi:hypothetical protein